MSKLVFAAIRKERELVPDNSADLATSTTLFFLGDPNLCDRCPAKPPTSRSYRLYCERIPILEVSGFRCTPAAGTRACLSQI